MFKQIHSYAVEARRSAIVELANGNEDLVKRSSGVTWILRLSVALAASYSLQVLAVVHGSSVVHGSRVVFL